MTLIKHTKINNITNWTQAQLNTVIAGGQPPLPPAGTVLNDIVLSSDWNADHDLSGFLANANAWTAKQTITLTTGAQFRTAYDTSNWTDFTTSSTSIFTATAPNGILFQALAGGGATDYLSFTSQSTGFGPLINVISATGNCPLGIYSKGTAALNLGTNAGDTKVTIANSGTTTFGSTSTTGNISVPSVVGAEQAPTLVAGNWTQGAGWASPIAGGILDKNADGTGTNTPTAATNIVSGTTYKVVITVSVWSVGSAVVTLGGGQAASLTAATTYTSYITASSTAKLIITPTNTSRFTISAISIIPLTAATGTMNAQGGVITTQPSAMGTVNITSGDNKVFSITDLLGNVLLDLSSGPNGGDSILKLYGNSTGNAGRLAIQSGGFIDTRGSNVLDISANNAGTSEHVIEVRATTFGSLGYNVAIMPAGSAFGFCSASSIGSGGLDSSISRISMGVFGFGTGAAGSVAGTVQAAYFEGSMGNALTAAGTTRTDALQLAAQTNNITTAAASTGVILPVGVIGMIITIFNGGANPLKVYASGSETIDGTSGSTGVTLTNAKRCQYFFTAALTWVSAQLGVTSA